MDNDTRIPLPTNVEFRLSILDEKGTPHDFTIKDEIARGGSCIVYSGVWNDTIGKEPPTPRDVIIKEFYPRSPKEPINRDNDSHELLIGGIPADKNRKFLLERDRFNRGQRMCAAYANKRPNFVLSQLVCSGSANNTSYAVLLRGEGTVLSKLDRSTINLTDAIEIAESLCDAISSIHDYKSSVYLDCKPDNISVSGNRVKLFDFDTMQPIDRISVPSFSVGFSAPEQIEEDEFGFIDTRNIGVHSDIFAIGATFFWLLTGKNPYEAGLKNIQSETSWVEAIDLKDTTDALQDKGFKSELVRIIRSVLKADPKSRKKAYGLEQSAIKLKSDFTHLKEIAKSAPDRREFEKTNENIDAGVKTIIDRIDALKESVSDGLSAKDNGDDSSMQKTIDVSKGGKKDDKSLGNVVIACVLLSVIIGCILFVLDLYGRNNNQADRSSEQATGSIQEDESDGELAWVYPGLSKAPLSQEEADIEVTFEPWDSTFGSTYIGETDASIGQSITVSGGTGTDTGMYLYDEKGNLLAQGRNGLFSNIVYFKINEELNYTLEPGTTYKYKFFAVVNGKTYWSSEQSFTTTKNDKTLDAEEQQTITIYFDANGGVCSTEYITAYSGRPVGTLPIPSRVNYDFVGWYLSDIILHNAKLTKDTVLDSDHTVSARWKAKTFTLTFDANGGTASFERETITFGESIGSLPRAYRDYATFDGWYLSDGITKVSEDTVLGSAESRTLYAHWKSGGNGLSKPWIKADEAPDGAEIIERKYTYTQRIYTSSSLSTMSGWNVYKYEWEWSDWGAWSEWSTSSVANSETRQIEAKDSIISYNMYTYVYTDYSSPNCRAYYSSPQDLTLRAQYVNTWSKSWLESSIAYSDGTYYNVSGHGNVAGTIHGGTAYVSPNDNYVPFFIGSTNYETQYRYRDRSKLYTYYYYKDENKESTSYPSGNNISNIVEWVKYRTE